MALDNITINAIITTTSNKTKENYAPRKTALKHANPKDPAFEDWQFVNAIAYDLLAALEEE